MQSGSESDRGRVVVTQTPGRRTVPFGELPLEVRSLSKRYKGSSWANRDINLTGTPGEILGILGPNGAGKTTLVRQITTELLPTSGTVSVLGYDTTRESNQVKALLGVVPQEAALFDYLTVFQHIKILAKLRGLKPRIANLRADRLIDDLDLTGYRDVPVGDLSGGMKRRVLLGVAAIADPPVMVLDEPTTGLDPQSRRSLWSLLRRHREEGAFVLLTTHSMEEAEALCDRVAIIQAGRLVVVDTMENLYANHGVQFKITYFLEESTKEGITLYGADQEELIARVRRKGVQQFSVGRANLEDVYLALTGEVNGLDDGEN